MSFHLRILTRVGSVFVLALPLVALNLAGQTPVVIQTNATVRVMAANLTSGTGQSYEAAGIRIFQGLKPDIVAIQEFRYNSSYADAQLRQLVDTAFGTSFFYYRETNNPSYNIPNGIVSRTLLRTPTTRVVLFGFAAGQELTEHVSPYDALVHVLDGEAVITISGKPFNLKSGQAIILPSGEPHALSAPQKFKMLLTMIRA